MNLRGSHSIYDNNGSNNNSNNNDDNNNNNNNNNIYEYIYMLFDLPWPSLVPKSILETSDFPISAE